MEPIPANEADDPDLLQHWQRAGALLARLPTSRELRSLRGGTRCLKLRCDRSLPFEFVDEFLPPFLGLWDADRATSLSDYDASLGGADQGAASAPDAHLLWLDWRLHRERLLPEAAAAWITEVAHRASARHGAPVMVNNWPAGGSDRWFTDLNVSVQRSLAAKPGFALIDVDGLRREVPDFIDARNDQLGNYPFSQRSSIAIARHIGCDLLPSLLGARLKALILDLDDTLYAGVLGEDGPQGVRLTEGHRALQERIRALKEQGLMIALCSRNEQTDVEALFRARPDFPLHLEDFASVRIDWRAKAENIAAIARDLNVDPSSLLFIDDNHAELARAAGALKGLRTLHASADGGETAAMLRHYPGLGSVGVDEAADLRTADIRANRAREGLRAQAADARSYLRQLDMVVEFHENDERHKARVFELSHKTNQFNLALARLSAAAVERAFAAGYFALTVRVHDSLSDSGVVGAVIASIDGEQASIQEFLFSCRALGREVETLTVLYACRRLKARGATLVRFCVTEGPRNLPAREWLARFVPGGVAPIDELIGRLEAACHDYPARIVEHRI